MYSRLKTSGEKSQTFTTSKFFRFLGVNTGGSDLTELLVNFGQPQLPGDKIRVKHLSIDYGIFDDPVDENIFFSLYSADPANPAIDLDSSQSQMWQGAVTFRVLDSTGVIQTTKHAEVKLDELVSYEGPESDRNSILLGAGSSSVAASILAMGALSMEVTLVQRQLADDFSEFEFDFVFEDTIDDEDNQ